MQAALLNLKFPFTILAAFDKDHAHSCSLSFFCFGLIWLCWLNRAFLVWQDAIQTVCIHGHNWAPPVECRHGGWHLDAFNQNASHP